MLTKRIIPCLDIKNGRTVKGVNFVDLRDAGDPVALAKQYADFGADELVFLDISATLEGRATTLEMVLHVAEQVNIPFTVGGGISSVEDVDALLQSGADKVSINSSAVKRPELVGKESFETLDEMYEATCIYLDKILSTVKPTKMIYIAIEGVAPVGKMKQQRMRRFKAVQDRHELDRIDTKHKCYKPSKFDYNMISPGTEFMIGLTNKLEEHLELVRHKYPKLEIILDDASNPGEGEHKITHHIRTKLSDQASVVVYGLDSDLIFLCLLQEC